MNSIHLALQDIMRKVFLMENLIVTPELSSSDVPGWDSIKQIDILLSAEEYFDIALDARQIDNLRNIGDLAKAIECKLAEKSSRSE